MQAHQVYQGPYRLIFSSGQLKTLFYSFPQTNMNLFEVYLLKIPLLKQSFPQTEPRNVFGSQINVQNSSSCLGLGLFFSFKVSIMLKTRSLTPDKNIYTHILSYIVPGFNNVCQRLYKQFVFLYKIQSLCL